MFIDLLYQCGASHLSMQCRFQVKLQVPGYIDNVEALGHGHNMTDMFNTAMPDVCFSYPGAAGLQGN